MFGRKRKRRARWREEGVSAEQRSIVERNVSAFGSLPEADRRELLGHTRVLLEEKRFEGLGGLEMTDEIRVTIAAQAALLLLHREATYFPSVKSVLVYPHAYVAPARTMGPAGMVQEGSQVRLGESWERGNVVLSWHHSLHGAMDAGDGHNVVLHEFAHQLDSEVSGMDGAPALSSNKGCVAAWARVLGDEFRSLRESALLGQQTVINKYGAQNPAEFFAVVTEAFFEKPGEVRARHPELYEQLACFYEQDPAGWGGR